MRFGVEDVQKAIKCLKPVLGFDGIHSFHLKLCPDSFFELISMFFLSYMVHNYIPLDMLKGVITPVIKDKNYRPVMSSSIFLKVLEYCIFHKIGHRIHLNERQHGFRIDYSTSTACLVLKETVLNYQSSGSNVYACFLDISKAFDSVNHSRLMYKLIDYGIPDIFVNLINFWYNNETVNVKYIDLL